MYKLFSLKKLLLIDGIAALLAGTLVLIFSYRLSVFFNLPRNLLQILAIISVAYSVYSIRLARGKTHSRNLVYFLVVANVVYTLFALCIVVYYFNTATVYGTVYFLAEAIFIGTLAYLEWRKII